MNNTFYRRVNVVVGVGLTPSVRPRGVASGEGEWIVTPKNAPRDLVHMKCHITQAELQVHRNHSRVLYLYQVMFACLQRYTNTYSDYSDHALHIADIPDGYKDVYRRDRWAFTPVPLRSPLRRLLRSVAIP